MFGPPLALQSHAPIMIPYVTRCDRVSNAWPPTVAKGRINGLLHST